MRRGLPYFYLLYRRCQQFSLCRGDTQHYWRFHPCDFSLINLTISSLLDLLNHIGCSLILSPSSIWQAFINGADVEWFELVVVLWQDAAPVMFTAADYSSRNKPLFEVGGISSLHCWLFSVLAFTIVPSMSALLTPHSLLKTYSLLIIYSLLLTHHTRSLVTHYSLIVICHSLIVTHFLLLVTCYS